MLVCWAVRVCSPLVARFVLLLLSCASIFSSIKPLATTVAETVLVCVMPSALISASGLVTGKFGGAVCEGGAAAIFELAIMEGGRIFIAAV